MPPSPPSEPRDPQARAVRRVTVGVAAAAVLGTAVFAGLAATGSQGSASADDPPAATDDQTGDEDPSVGGVVDDMLDRFFRDDDAEAPSGSERAPVAPSGGS